MVLRGPIVGPLSLIALLGIGQSGAGARQQPRATVRGRVVERRTSQGIAGADVALSGWSTVLTDDSGAFEIARVPAGRYTLSVQAPGYGSVERVLIVLRDTTVTIALAPAPFMLDTLRVRTRQVTVRGEVKDAATRRQLVDVSVVIGERQTLTNPAGSFKLSHIPADVRFLLSLRDFGYIPLEKVVRASADTILPLFLTPDPLIQRMVARQVARLQRQAEPFHSVSMRALDRQALIDQGGGSAFDMLKEKYGRSLHGLNCVFIDDVQTATVKEGLEQLQFLVPAELQRVEVLTGVIGGEQMRVYTRQHMRRMLGDTARVRPPSPCL